MWYKDIERSNRDSFDILALSLHPLQTAVPEDMLLRGLSRTLVQLVNQLGVDLNKVSVCLSLPCVHALLAPDY